MVWCGCLAVAFLWGQGAPPVLAQQTQQRPREEAKAPKEAGAPKQVKLAKVKDTPLERTTVALGSLVAFDQATISVKVPGRLRSIAVELGTVVQRGQLIAQIEPQDYQLRCNRPRRPWHKIGRAHV